MTACDRKSAFAQRPGDPRPGDAGSKTAPLRAPRNRNGSSRDCQSTSRRSCAAASRSWRSSAGRWSPRCRAILAHVNSLKGTELGSMDDLTEVELYWQQGRVERWIRFGSSRKNASSTAVDASFRFRPKASSPSSAGRRMTWHDRLSYRHFACCAAGKANLDSPRCAAWWRNPAPDRRLAQGRTGSESDRRDRGARRRSEGCSAGPLEPSP